MKRSTALGHLVETAQTATEQLGLRETDIGWPAEELWVAGDLVGFAETISTSAVVVVLDVPPEEVSWLAINPAGEWIGETLRLGKRPLGWCYRPLAWPVWNHRNRRLVRYWSATQGLDDAVIDALRHRRFETLPIAEPTPDELARQLRIELAVSRRHLRRMVDRYENWDWSRRRRQGESPEQHLWRAAAAVTEMLDALDELAPR